MHGAHLLGRRFSKFGRGRPALLGAVGLTLLLLLARGASARIHLLGHIHSSLPSRVIVQITFTKPLSGHYSHMSVAIARRKYGRFFPPSSESPMR
jgi:hypothetical protein